MARKTTKLCKTLIARHNELVEHFSEVIEAIDRGEIYVDGMTKEEAIGMARGNCHMLTATLMESNCYHGFKYVDSLGQPTLDESEMLDWRIHFYIKE